MAILGTIVGYETPLDALDFRVLGIFTREFKHKIALRKSFDILRHTTVYTATCRDLNWAHTTDSLPELCTMISALCALEE